MDQSISSEFPFESKFVEVKGSKMHFVDVGEGDPILFLHGQPTSSYLWRNIIPHLNQYGRCIAPDLIGMGKSGKPKIDYTYDDHYEYLEQFIKKLKLENITLVIHDWGSGLGFHYANNHRGNIKGIAFMEALIEPLKWENFPANYKIMFRLIRAPFIGWIMLSVANLFLKKVLPDSMLRKLSKEEFDNYLQPYPSISSRKPVRKWPQQVPINGKPKGVHDKIKAYNEWLTETDIPKLCLYVHPGAIITQKEVKYMEESFPNIKLIDIGEGIHFVQEDNPHVIGKEIAAWIKDI